jgi:hypothetical protein
MTLVKPRSLAQTLDAVNDALFSGKKLTLQEQTGAAKWIAGRQGLPRSYAGMFAPTDYDFNHWPRLYTGEELKSNASTAHILGEEACRALLLLDVKARPVSRALAAATASFSDRLSGSVPRQSGLYCCGTCSVALWRHLAAGGLDDPEQRLAHGIQQLKKARDGKGRWRRFPFHYTLLALSELDSRAALAEMRYAAPSAERSLKRDRGRDKYARRRRSVMERVLAKV